jgi:hypothetical protein
MNAGLDPGPVPPAATAPDPLDAVTWVQYRAAFKIAALALGEIAAGGPSPAEVAAAALQAMRAEVSRFDASEPSWQPPRGLSPGGNPS